MSVGFMTQRTRLLDAYKAANQAITCRTIPYHSTTRFQGDVVNFAGGTTPGVGYVVFRRNQSRTLFNYGVGNQVDLGGLGGQTTATEADTNMGKASSTNGAEDFVIEGVGFHQRGVRVAFATGTGNLYAGPGVPTDPTVLGSLTGDVDIYDPAAINAPPQIMSPFNLENGILNAILPLISVSFLFDRKRTEKIGTVDVMPCTSAKSYLRSNGEPSQNNMYRIPEGYLWRRDGQPDSEFTAQLNLERDLVVPINGILPYVTGATSPAAPATIWLEVTMRLFGLAVDLPSAN